MDFTKKKNFHFTDFFLAFTHLVLITKIKNKEGH